MNKDELRQWFEEHVTINGKNYLLDEEQAAIILDEHKNAIVTARAGSGKTHTLVAKIVYLVAIKKVKPSQIMALGFNKGPQDDFQKRLNNVLIDGKPLFAGQKIAKTFHSFAYDIANIPGDILFGDDQNSYIETIVNNIVDPKFIYEYIRDDSHEPKREDYENDADYYAAIRYTRYETLSGESVKSRGEKIISDYLFEHGIENKYESFSLFPSKLTKYAKSESDKAKLAGKEKITPDFCIEHKDRRILWEHWGITGNEVDAEIERIDESGAVGQYADYLANKLFKEWFYSGEWLDESKIKTKEALEDKYLSVFLQCDNALLSTNYKKGIAREDFEEEIRKKLAAFGITNKKLSQEELLEKFKDNQNNMVNTVNRVTQFIQRAEQQFPGDFNGLCDACAKTTDSQVKKFYKVSLLTYKYYLSELTADPSKGFRKLLDDLFEEKNYTDDYALLMNRAASRIKDGANGKTIDIDGIDYLFLDEYQDFSLLFHNLVKAIQDRKKSIKILAVGDDWQAINSYAGASLEYFNEFEKFFPEDCIRLRIKANRRSEKSIVEAANSFMKNALDDENGSTAIKADTADDVLNNCTIGDIRNFWSEGKHIDRNNHHKYWLLLAEILNANAGKTFKLLNRTNDIKYDDYDKESLSRFEKDFKAQYRNKIRGVDVDNDISFMSVNSSKGLESDIVVILETDIGRFPIFHPDNYLYEVFGESEQKAIDEQKRLFYVALTRAKEKVYIVHKNGYICSEQERRGDFLNYLGIDSIPKFDKPAFMTIEKQILEGYRTKIRATSIDFRPNKFNPENVDIFVETTNLDTVRQWNAFPNGSHASQLRRLSQNCNKLHPVDIKAISHKASNGKSYVWMYDGRN